MRLSGSKLAGMFMVFKGLLSFWFSGFEKPVVLCVNLAGRTLQLFLIYFSENFRIFPQFFRGEYAINT